MKVKCLPVCNDGWSREGSVHRQHDLFDAIWCEGAVFDAPPVFTSDTSIWNHVVIVGADIIVCVDDKQQGGGSISSSLNIPHQTDLSSAVLPAQGEAVVFALLAKPCPTGLWSMAELGAAKAPRSIGKLHKNDESMVGMRDERVWNDAASNEETGHDLYVLSWSVN